MSDLISRSELNDVIDLLEVYTSGRPNSMKVEISVLQLQRFINKLKNISTSYDIDKVVEELNKASYLVSPKNKGHYADNAIDLEDAIEIVKQGGVYDYVCDWKLDGVYIFSPHSRMFSCVIDNKHRYTYCPVCGKKIKVVE